MKHRVKILTKKETRAILELIKHQWGAELGIDFAFLQTKKDKIYLISTDLGKIDSSKLRIDSIGLYFAELKHGELRLSIEGSQLVGPFAKKNVVELSEEEIEQWLKGNDIVKHVEAANGFVILKHGSYFAGCGKYRDGVILNFVPKARRIMVSELP